MFSIAYDGFVQTHLVHSWDEIVPIWNKDRKNTNLYQYDIAVYELNPDKSIKRRVPETELLG